MRARWLAPAVLALALAAAALAADPVEEFLRRHWARPLAPQGAAPARWTPVEQSLAPEACGTCHPAPLAEQAPLVLEGGAARPNPAHDAALGAHGLACAACHVRGHARFGPPRRAGALERAAPGASLPHGGATRTPAFLRAEFCRSCHQFAPDGLALNGKLLEDTYNEWRSSRFAREGTQCQDCHMPDPRHLWRGLHDAGMVRSGL